MTIEQAFTLEPLASSKDVNLMLALGSEQGANRSSKRSTSGDARTGRGACSSRGAERSGKSDLSKRGSDSMGSSRSEKNCRNAPAKKTPQENIKDPVCIHWKTKGWCRYENNCKFEHSVAQCGVEAAGKMVAAPAAVGPCVSGLQTAQPSLPGCGLQLAAPNFGLPFVISAPFVTSGAQGSDFAYAPSVLRTF